MFYAVNLVRESDFHSLLIRLYTTELDFKDAQCNYQPHFQIKKIIINWGIVEYNNQTVKWNVASNYHYASLSNKVTCTLMIYTVTAHVYH